MATKRKKLTRAKAQAACDALNTLLDGTSHDERLTSGDRATLSASVVVLDRLRKSLGRDEFDVHMDAGIKAILDQADREGT